MAWSNCSKGFGASNRAGDLQEELEELFNRENKSSDANATSIPTTFLHVTVAV
jgi:hypothetical protein